MIESKLKSSVILRMIIVAFLTLLLLVPTIFVEFLIMDRQERRDSAIKEVSQSWGASQTLSGPILSVPYWESRENQKEPAVSTLHYIHFLPSKLMIHSTLSPEIRYRGIYEVGLYNAHILIEGEFASLDIDKANVTPDKILWQDAFITMGISDLKGIRDTVNLNLNQSSYPSDPGVLTNDVVESGVTFKTPMEHPTVKQAFSLKLNLNGSSEIRFIPVGASTELTMDSPWSEPSFVGNYLPETRTVDAKGFHAQWSVLNLNRNFPQVLTGNKYKLSESSFGVRLFLPVDGYQKTSRTVKYAILFIGLTFISFFLSEVIAKVILHPIQYVLIGFALVLFYVLLLSLSEYIPFNFAYAISSLSAIALVTVYSRWITRGGRISIIIPGVLVLLYTFLFVTLQLQDYALLMGSVGLFFILILIMYLTRSIDWFSLGKQEG
jgi:inner membrane protein